METTIFVRCCSMNSINKLFSEGINNNATIKFYKFITGDKCKMLVRHSEEVALKENATYTLDGFLKRCRTELDILRHKLSLLESKLYEEQSKQHSRINRMGWGYGMRNTKCSISTTREDRLKDKISEIKKRIKELQN